MKRPEFQRKTRLSLCLRQGGARGMIAFGLMAAAGAVQAATADIVPVLQEHCVGCHGKDGKVKGEVNLLEAIAGNQFKAKPDLLANVIKMVRNREMPPEDEPALAPEVHGRLLGDLQAMLDADIASGAATPRTPIRRMNRFQYANAVEDLLDLKVELFALPERIVREYGGYFDPAKGQMPDVVTVGNRPLGKSQLIGKRLNGVAPFPQDLRAGHGFDTRADLISMSPLLMESFLALGQSIVNSPDFGPKTCGIWNSFFAAPVAGAGDDGKIAEIIRQRLRTFLTRAFREPVAEDVLERYAAHAAARLKAGIEFTACMKESVAAALVSPRFLYLYDGASTGAKPETITDLELATRLSFFLWGSIPDQPLLELAAKGSLHEPATLAAQVDRMLADHRMKRFCDSFPAQWLKIEHLFASEPDEAHFADFYWRPRQDALVTIRASTHMIMEPLLLFEAILIENRPIQELIQPDFSYRSEALSHFYRHERVGNVTPTKDEFVRVPITSKREGGVITNAAVMTMTSEPVRTKPVTRGAWVVDVIFNNPPKPPPADVPPLEKPGQPGVKANLTIREKLKLHQERADCASCHAKIDPYGFALENYDPVGRWRDTYEGELPIDPSGKLNQRPFSNLEEFKDALLRDKDRFTRALAGHLLAYGLGREVSAADQPALDRIVKSTADEEYRIRALIRNVALSQPFSQKFNPDKKPELARN
jgi:mono/diheme cytochrome c family protein